MSTIQDFTGCQPTWCPGCGDWGIGIAIKSALVQLGLDPSSLFAAFGIGCSGNMNDFLNAYAMHGLHGRSIPNVIGMKLANHKAVAVAIAGDGDCYGEGGNHFLHVCRGNHDVTVIIHDNRVYGLTTGQSAPTAQKGYKSKSTPLGIIEESVDPLSLALTQGATFVAQAFAGDAIHMTSMIKQAVEHKGFSLVNILQPCVTFNKINTYQYYMKRVYKLSETYNKSDIVSAVEKAREVYEEKYPLGVLYEIHKPAYHEQIIQLNDVSSLIERDRFTDFPSLMSYFK